MKEKKILLIAIILILIGVLLGSVNYANQDDDQNENIIGEAPAEVNLIAETERPFSDDNGDDIEGNDRYGFLGKYSGLSRGYTVFKISEEDDLEHLIPYYCLRGRVGFGATPDQDVSSTAVKYKRIGEMHKNALDLINRYNEVYINENGGNVNLATYYNQILWIIDNIYIPTDNIDNGYTAQDFKTELLDKVEQYVRKTTSNTNYVITETEREKITDDDLEVIGQLAIWYYTNKDDTSNLSVSRPERNISAFLGFIDEELNYDNNRMSQERKLNLDFIYEYYIDTANENAAKYGEEDTRELISISREFADLDLKVETIDLPEANPRIQLPENHFYKIGPFKIGENTQNIISPDDITVIDNNGTEIPRIKNSAPVFYYLDSDGNQINTTENPLHEGTVYYLKFLRRVAELNNYDMTTVTLKASSHYWKTTADIYEAEENPSESQIVVRINKELVESEGEKTSKKIFDLSLRKFIKNVESNGTARAYDRVPRIDISTLKNGIRNESGATEFTATYSHPGTPVPVDTGDIVKYGIRVYNEGNMDGIAKEVTDYLPDGLEFIPASESEVNARYGWTSEDGKVVKTSYLEDTVIKAVDNNKRVAGNEVWQSDINGNGGLYYAEIEIECRVVANPKGEKTSLRNIAAITEDADEEGNDVEDRDSVPGNPGLEDYQTKVDYSGTKTNSTYKQDDDDFELLELRAAKFDLALRKFITKVERTENGQTTNLTLTSREPKVEIAGLKDGTATTARYVHPKDTLTLKRGDVIYYTIRVYNEGEIAGYATEIKDYLGDGLEFVADKNTDFTTTDGKTLTSVVNKDVEIPAYNKNVTSLEQAGLDENSKIKWKYASDDSTGLYFYDLTVVCKVKEDVQDNAVLVNIAEINGDIVKPSDIDDRDSQPANFPDENKNNDYRGNGEENGYFPGKQDDDDFEPITIEARQVFDLALRKYITKVESANGTVKTITNARELNTIDTNKLNRGETTADYLHRKDAVEVEPGDKVTYTFRVYNEGEIKGKVTSITDYLPQGLELDTTGLTKVDSSDENIEVWEQKVSDGYIPGTTITTTYTVNKTASTLTITREYNHHTSIPGNSETIENYLFKLNEYDPTNTSNEEYDAMMHRIPDLSNIGTTIGKYGYCKGLNYGEISVNFKVTAQVKETDQFLTNAATMNYGPVEAEVADRDSKPEQFNVPAQNVLVNNSETAYKGNDANKTELNDSEYHYKGQQDDDDFEKIVIKGKSFDMALRKYITKLERNGEEVTISNPRNLENIDLSKLTSGTTADYKHRKDPVVVEIGDIVTYTFKVYNEGNFDGEVQSITDYLPTGLELDTTGLTVLTYRNDGTTIYKDGEGLIYECNFIKGSIKIAKEDGTKLFAKIDAFNGTTLDNESITLKLKVTAEVSENDKVLTNVATMDYGPINANLTDRDSKSEEFNVPSQTDLPGYKGKDTNKAELNDGEYHYEGQQDDDDFEKVIVKGKKFDMALRKYITKLERSGENITIPNSRYLDDIDLSKLSSGTTAGYNHLKSPVEVEVGDIVTYTFKVYNEGEFDGYVTSITDYLPRGLELDTTGLTQMDTNVIDNTSKWVSNSGIKYVYNMLNNSITISRVPAPGDDTTKLFTKIDAFDGTTLDDESITLKLRVTADVSGEDKILTNVATMKYGPINSNLNDIDSKPEEFNVPSQTELPAYKGKDTNKADLSDEDYHYEGQQDDDDFEKVVVKGKAFDLALRKFITSVKRNGTDLEIDDRTPSIDLTTLVNGTFDRNGHTEYTATYNHPKDPIVVRKGDIITYKLRIYNEGERDGYATEITDYIPEGLALISNYKTNYDNGWTLPEDIDNSKVIKLIGEDGFYKTEDAASNFNIADFKDIASLKDVNLITGKVKIKTTALDDELIKAYDKTTTAPEGWQKAETGEGGLFYKDVEVTCLVIAENKYKGVITNFAEISEDKDSNRNDVIDRDSTPNDVTEPYDKWQEDDDDYEPVVLKNFDLALRKFITQVESAGEKEEITSRIPVPKVDENGNIKYEHSKDPVYVVTNDVVTYTIRVFNEGTTPGYAEEITDDMPEGLVFLPEHSTNKKYEWKMLDKDGKVTDNINEAVKVSTAYLSSERERTISNEPDEDGFVEILDNLLKAFDSTKPISQTNPDYRDVKIAFRVTEPTTSDRIITNSAHITKDSDDDIDSHPDEWIEGEDDQDVEHVYVKYFDLSLLKWVTKTVVTVDNTTTTRETGFEPNTGKTETYGIRSNDAKEPIAKVEVHRKKLDKTTVKFVYQIRVTNEGEIEGYATEITDIIPEGLMFLEEDNKAFGWEETGDGRVTTRALETTLLKPGESAEVTIVFTWKNNEKNLGLKTNIAHITEDYNKYDVDDIDSTPDNLLKPYEKEQEDDDDFALVMLSIETGKGAEYTLFATAMLALLAGGIYLIKKYVLTY